VSTNHVSVRLDAGTMERVAALAPAFSTEWRVATRSDILRGLILDALERFEKSAAHPAGRARASRDAGTRLEKSAPAGEARKPRRVVKPKR
jgi:hypothetical protein